MINDAGGDTDIPNRCYTRIHLIRQKKRGLTGSGASLPVTPGSGEVPTAPTTTIPTTTTATRPASASDRPTLLPPVRTDGPGATADGPQWTGPGVLKGTAVVLDNKPTYALETAPGVISLYVVGAPGVDLRTFMNRRVELYGTVQRHRDVTKRYVIVTKVDPNPNP